MSEGDLLHRNIIVILYPPLELFNIPAHPVHNLIRLSYILLQLSFLNRKLPENIKNKLMRD